MANRPIINTTRTLISGKMLTADSVLEPALGANAAGMTAVPTAVQRKVSVALVGQVGTTKNSIIFRAPPSGATILRMALTSGTQQGHAAGETKTWKFSVANISKGVSLTNTCSLSNQTLTATGFKNLPMNRGNCTLASGDGLQLKLIASGGPASMTSCAVFVEWTPKNNA